MQITQIIQENYTTYQLFLPLDLGIIIPKNDELRTYCELMKAIKLDKYFKNESTQGRKRKNRAAILNTILFGFMTHIRSTRRIKLYQS